MLTRGERSHPPACWQRPWCAAHQAVGLCQHEVSLTHSLPTPFQLGIPSLSQCMGVSLPQMQDLLNFIRFLSACLLTQPSSTQPLLPTFPSSEATLCPSIQIINGDLWEFWTRYGLLSITTSDHLPTRCHSKSSEVGCSVDFQSTSLSAHLDYTSSASLRSLWRLSTAILM